MLFYSHYVGIIYVGILYLGIFLFYIKERIFHRHILISIFINIFSYIPWLPYAFDDLLEGAHGYAGGSLNLINFLYWIFCYFFGPVPSKINDLYIWNLIILTFIINLSITVILIISIIGFTCSYVNNDYYDSKSILNIIIFLICLIFGIPIVLGVLIPNSFTAKNVIGGLSLIYIVQGFGLYYLFIDKKSSFFKNSKKFLKVFKP